MKSITEDNILDRTIPPQLGQVEKINLIQASEKKLANGIPVYFINGGTEDVVKIEFLFPAGAWYEEKPIVASATNSMLNEGTQHLSAADIADKIDYYGAFMQTHSSSNWASVTLFTLNKYLGNTLPVIYEVLTESLFPEHEIETFKQNQKQNLIVNNERVDYIAKRKFSEIIFGSKHPYGHYVSLVDYDELMREDLVNFFKRYYNVEHCKIIISGRVNEDTLNLLDNIFGHHNWNVNKTNGYTHHVGLQNFASLTTAKEKKHFIERKDAVQSSIRIGKPLFNKLHPDFIGMQILNTAFGGYFSSRLMTNIREDKGYTYGIGSAVVSLHDTGYFFITTEVGVDVCSKTIDEIYFEMERLREKPIPAEELQLMKNYLMGIFLRSIDGPFSLADKFKSILIYNLGYDYYERFLHTVQTINSETLLQLAEKYFQRDSMFELVVGKRI